MRPMSDTAPQEARGDAALAAAAAAVFTPNYRPAPIALSRGEGAYVWDADGRRYLDMTAGIAVSALGHAHPGVLAAIRAQSQAILHTSNLYLNEPSIALAERLVARSFAERVFFCNSGAEANEASIKLARRYAYKRGEVERTEVISFTQSFHGRTYGALRATAQPKFQEGFGPMPAGFTYLEAGDVAALKAAASDKTAAIMLEPVQGEGGVRPQPPGFIRACRELADQVGALLIFDEVQTGIGRTGALFAYELEGVAPDIMSLAKGLGGGLPIGAMLCTEAVGQALDYGSHGTTFGGNPVACKVGCVVLDAIDAALLSHVNAMGARLKAGLEAMGGVFSEVRGRGLLVGAELADPELQAGAVVDRMREGGVLGHVAGARVLRFLPPLTITEAELDEALAAVKAALSV